MRCYDFCSPIPHRFVAFAPRYHVVLTGSLLAERSTARRGLGLGPPAPLPVCSRGDEQISQVPGEPCRVFALDSDSGRALAPRHRGASVLPPVRATWRPQRVTNLSKLDSTAFTLTVYASPRGHPFRRKTRFRLVATLYRVGLATHRVPKHVSFHLLTSSCSRLGLAQARPYDRQNAGGLH